MHRRNFVTHSLTTSALAVFGSAARAAGPAKLEPLPKRRTTKVAFLLGENANVIDTAGPWEVFQDVHVDALVGRPLLLRRRLRRGLGRGRGRSKGARKNAGERRCGDSPAGRYDRHGRASSMLTREGAAGPDDPPARYCVRSDEGGTRPLRRM